MPHDCINKFKGDQWQLWLLPRLAITARLLRPVGIDPTLSEKPSPDLENAEKRAMKKGLTLGGVGGVAEDLPFESESFDAVVSTMVFCSVRDPAAALREVGPIGW